MDETTIRGPMSPKKKKAQNFVIGKIRYRYSFHTWFVFMPQEPNPDCSLYCANSPSTECLCKWTLKVLVEGLEKLLDYT